MEVDMLYTVFLLKPGKIVPQTELKEGLHNRRQWLGNTGQTKLFTQIRI